MPTTFMYKYTDMMDLAIRRYCAKNLLSEYDLLNKMNLSWWTLSKCRKYKKISRPMIVRFENVGISFKWITFELYE